MSIQWSLLCPVDFSPASRGALHYALAIARRCRATLTVLTVDDRLMVEVGDARMGDGWSHAASETELRRFVAEAERGFEPVPVVYDVRAGKPAPIILLEAAERPCDLIVMGTHGRTGLSKFVFGATAERVLRGTTVPVLLTPADPGALSFDDLASQASPLLVPVDFGPPCADQIAVAASIAASLQLRLMIGHVVEPVELPPHAGVDDGDVLSERHRRACRGLQSIAIASGLRPAAEMLIATGEPADEIARWVHDKHAGMLLMALRSDCEGGPRMGSVTYRAIARSRVLTLALPPPSARHSASVRPS
jgi:nucleotide-binding universal stress UspA family protein